MSTPIPYPPGLPLFGNLTDVDPVNSIADLNRLADIYGPIYTLTIGGETKAFISSHAFFNEACDVKRWEKCVAASLRELRGISGSSLFTAYNDEHDWAIAHRVLMPAFGPLKIKSMFDEMHDISSQLVVKWARLGPSHPINVTEDFTRLTLDSIALCAMGIRFNSFYKDGMHPFVDAMNRSLAEASIRSRRLAIAQYFANNQQWDSDRNFMRSTVQELLAERKKHPADKEDLLNAMIRGVDPQTGEGLSEECIMNNMITFLIAGHETTSGLISFLFYHLIKNPAAYQAAQKEVDTVVGRGAVKPDHMSRLPYLNACLRETLRLNPTAPAFTLTPRAEAEQPVLLGGKYEIPKGMPVIALLGKIQTDPAVWGEDAAEFRPERMLDEPFSKLPKNAWKPFGNGVRGCIGRPFAWQETLLVTALILQNFNVRFEDCGYNLVIKQTLTIKPSSFRMLAQLRNSEDPTHLEKRLHLDATEEDKKIKQSRASKGTPSSRDAKSPMSIFYGSNTGTCEALARSLARASAGRGFQVKVDTLNAAVNAVPKGQPVIMIASSYDGAPPDNAAHFWEWLSSLQGEELKGVNYTVFGCGNRDWTATFHKVPRGIDAFFSANGATRLVDIGLSDVAAGDIFNDFDRWQDEKLWPTVGAGEGDKKAEAGFEVIIDKTSRSSDLRQDVQEAVVLNNELLTSGTEAPKRHIKLQLPTGTNYKVGDYMAVLPINNTKTVRRVLKRFDLPWDSFLTIQAGSNSIIPTHPIPAATIFAAYFELGQPATRKNVALIAESIVEPDLRDEVHLLATTKFDTEITTKRRSPLDILEEHPTAQLPLGSFLAMLPPMRIRQYSISSSPLSDPTTATLTWSVLATPSKTSPEKQYLGVASNYLSNVEPGDRIHIAIKPSHGNFQLPADVEGTPIIMICAGAGIAPFRGFVQERAMQISAGRKLAAAYLFVGCTHPERDLLFKSELEDWEAMGAVRTFYAFSRASEVSKGARYVQDRLWEEREVVIGAIGDGARLYVCGSSAVGEGVADSVKRIYREGRAGEGRSEEEVEVWWDGIKVNRYASDVFN